MRSPTNQMRRAQTVDGGGRKRNRDYAPIRIVIRAISPHLARQTEGGGGWAKRKLFMRPAARLFMRFRSKVIAGFRVACSSATWMGEFERFRRLHGTPPRNR